MSTILAFAGSTRRDSYNRRLVQAFRKSMAERGVAVEVLDLASYPLPLYSADDEEADGIPENATRLRSVILKHPKIFIATPEYNAFPPPLLFNTIAWLSRITEDGGAKAAFGGRTFALGSASPGSFGGYRALMALRHLLELTLAARVLPQMVSVPVAAKAFDAQGGLQDAQPRAKLEALVAHLLDC